MPRQCRRTDEQLAFEADDVAAARNQGIHTMWERLVMLDSIVIVIGVQDAADFDTQRRQG